MARMLAFVMCLVGIQLFSKKVFAGKDLCRKVITTSSGSIQSPNYPKTYNNYAECEYFIRPLLPSSRILKLVPESFDLEGGYDMLEVRDMGPHGPYLGHFTGSTMPALYGKSFWLRFTSDYSNGKRGFKFNWSVVDEGVRLVNGTNALEGRVEVFHNSRWGTICDDSWGSHNAWVVCHMLGFNEANPLFFAHAFFGRGLDPIWLDNVVCSRNKTSLSRCSHATWGDHNCNHGEDAGAQCTSAFSKLKRLVGKRTSFPKGCSGWYTNSTGLIASPQFPLYPNFAQCEYTITPPAAIKVTQLTFTRFNLQQDADFLEIREESSTGPFIGRFTGNQLPPVFYATSFWIAFTSDPSLGREGFEISWAAVQYGVRLRNGTRYTEGRVEVFHGGVWGSICDDSWDRTEATVVCRMMGFNSSNGTGVAVKGGTFGPGVGKIKLDDMGCTGDESSLDDCNHPAYETHNCNHYEDAGARCLTQTRMSPSSLPQSNTTVVKNVEDAVNVTCDSMTLWLSVSISALKAVYPQMNADSLYLTLATPDCVGQTDNDTISFTTDITACGMTATETDDLVIYGNRLIPTNNGSGDSSDPVRRPSSIVIPVECRLSKTVSLKGRMNVYRMESVAGTVRGYGNFTAKMDFYKDPNYALIVYDYPMFVEAGQEVYVETKIKTKDKSLKAVLYECVATAPNQTDVPPYHLISNKCPVDRTTRLEKTNTNSSVRFHFKTFQFLEDKGEVYIACTLLVCNVTDNSPRCQTGCARTRRHIRSAETRKEVSVDVVQGPLIFKTASSVYAPRRRFPVSAIVAVCALVVLVIVVLALLLRRRRKGATVLHNNVYSEYDVHKDDVAMMSFELQPDRRSFTRD